MIHEASETFTLTPFVACMLKRVIRGARLREASFDLPLGESRVLTHEQAMIQANPGMSYHDALVLALFTHFKDDLEELASRAKLHIPEVKPIDVRKSCNLVIRAFIAHDGRNIPQSYMAKMLLKGDSLDMLDAQIAEALDRLWITRAGAYYALTQKGRDEMGRRVHRKNLNLQP